MDGVGMDVESPRSRLQVQIGLGKGAERARQGSLRFRMGFAKGSIHAGSARRIKVPPVVDQQMPDRQTGELDDAIADNRQFKSELYRIFDRKTISDHHHKADETPAQK